LRREARKFLWYFLWKIFFPILGGGGAPRVHPWDVRYLTIEDNPLIPMSYNEDRFMKNIMMPISYNEQMHGKPFNTYTTYKVVYFHGNHFDT
jgi:hypothetical protein